MAQSKAQTTEKVAPKTAKDTRKTFSVVTKGLETKSSKIRALNAAGYSRSEIAKQLDIRYQHVRNVLITPLKGESKSA